MGCQVRINVAMRGDIGTASLITAKNMPKKLRVNFFEGADFFLLLKIVHYHVFANVIVAYAEISKNACGKSF